MTPRHDLHVHSTFSDGKSTLDENVQAAEQAGLEVLGLVDHVRSSTEWVPEFLDAVDALRPHTDLELLVGVEAKILDTSGAVDAPAVLTGVDYVALADHAVPTPDGPRHPAEVKSRIKSGELRRSDVAADVVVATAAAARRCPRALVVHLFSVLPKAGLTEDEVDDELVGLLAVELAGAGAVVEINERWRCPSPRVVVALQGAGVPLVASTDSHRAATIGRYDYVTRMERMTGVTIGRVPDILRPVVRS